MSNPDRTIDPRLLDAAKDEFQAKGFMKASIRKICSDAGVTTGAFYKRYNTKEELFNAIVSPVIEELMKSLDSIEPEDMKLLEESDDLSAVWANPNDIYFFDHKLGVANNR